MTQEKPELGSQEPDEGTLDEIEREFGRVVRETAESDTEDKLIQEELHKLYEDASRPEEKELAKLKGMEIFLDRVASALKTFEAEGIINLNLMRGEEIRRALLENREKYLERIEELEDMGIKTDADRAKEKQNN